MQENPRKKERKKYSYTFTCGEIARRRRTIAQLARELWFAGLSWENISKACRVSFTAWRNAIIYYYGSDFFKRNGYARRLKPETTMEKFVAALEDFTKLKRYSDMSKVARKHGIPTIPFIKLMQRTGLINIRPASRFGRSLRGKDNKEANADKSKMIEYEKEAEIIPMEIKE